MIPNSFQKMLALLKESSFLWPVPFRTSPTPAQAKTICCFPSAGCDRERMKAQQLDYKNYQM